ncbi:pyridoxamine 5'-phosphate oxidase family protein [Streptomyces sp. NPDC059740]|uniref:pyridoxamine 5'-phosphate oxidase family protein n=1 Tax=Streptomyces sp. NPDC059740 TaxID=3346926 RepID=UPI0036545A6F
MESPHTTQPTAGDAATPSSQATAPRVPAAYLPTDLTTPTRSPKRARYDHETVHAVLDAGYLCHLGFVRDGRPVVLPTLYGRDGGHLYLHGSTGSRPLRAAGGEDGLPVCVTVTHVDGLVLAKSAFHHSVNYRSVVVHGTAHTVTDPQEKTRALDLLVDHVLPGRAADSRPADAKELAATAVIRLDLAEVSVKMRTGGPSDDPADADLPYWSGVLPVVTSYGTPEPDGDRAEGTPEPSYLFAR